MLTPSTDHLLTVNKRAAAVLHCPPCSVSQTDGCTPINLDPICRRLVCFADQMMSPCAGRTNHPTSDRLFEVGAVSLGGTSNVCHKTRWIFSCQRSLGTSIFSQTLTGCHPSNAATDVHSLPNSKHAMQPTGQSLPHGNQRVAFAECQ